MNANQCSIISPPLDLYTLSITAVAKHIQKRLFSDFVFEKYSRTRTEQEIIFVFFFVNLKYEAGKLSTFILNRENQDNLFVCVIE